MQKNKQTKPNGKVIILKKYYEFNAKNTEYVVIPDRIKNCFTPVSYELKFKEKLKK